MDHFAKHTTGIRPPGNFEESAALGPEGLQHPNRPMALEIPAYLSLNESLAHISGDDADVPIARLLGARIRWLRKGESRRAARCSPKPLSAPL